MKKHICNRCGEEMESTEDGGWYCEECGWWEEDKNENEEDMVCDHEFISREYISQPYGTCMTCGRTIFIDNTKR